MNYDEDEDTEEKSGNIIRIVLIVTILIAGGYLAFTTFTGG